MATAGYNSSPYILDNAFAKPGDVLGMQVQSQRQDAQINAEKDYRRQKDEEADQWKKINLIQDLTDLSKHQTGSDVANAVGNEQATKILQKYTAIAPKMSANELMAKVQQDMSGLVSGMDAMKNELAVSDEELKAIKQMYPGVNISDAARIKRADILNRRLHGNGFVNPLEVMPSQVDFNDPEVLSEFITDDSGLVKAITNPQGGEAESVLMGKQGDYTKFEGKLNYWKKPNYDRTKYNAEGFYTGREIPSFVTKGSELPSDALPSSNGKPFKIIDKDVLDQFTSDANQRLGLLAATKRRYPTYNSFSQQEKEYAQRNVLFDMVETLDPSQLHPTANVRPQVVHNRSTTNVNLPGGGSNVNDLYSRIKSKVQQASGTPKFNIASGMLNNAERVSNLALDESNLIIDFVNKSYPDKGADEKPKRASELYLKEDENGNINVYDDKENNYGTLPAIGTNIKVQPGVKEKREVVASGDKVGSGTIKGSEVPKGAKVTQKDGAFYYNGKKII